MSLPIAAQDMCMECLSSTLTGPQHTYKRVAVLAALVASLPLGVALTRTPTGGMSLDVGLTLLAPGNLLGLACGVLGLVLGAITMLLAFRGKGRRGTRVLGAAGILAMSATLLLVYHLGH